MNSKRDKPTLGDVADTALKTTLSTIAPGSGELLNLLIGTPTGRRRQEWITSLETRLKILESKGTAFDLESEAFVSSVLRASQIALRNHQNEKREALLNAISNIASRRTPEHDEQEMFLAYIDSLTTWHLRALRWLGGLEPKTTIEGTLVVPEKGDIGRLVTAYPELRGRSGFCEQILRDLHQRGLVSTPDHSGMLSGESIFPAEITEFGKRFLAFIEAPPEEHK